MGRAGILGDSFIRLHRVGVVDPARWRFALVRHGTTFLVSYPQHHQSCSDYAENQ